MTSVDFNQFHDLFRCVFVARSKVTYKRQSIATMALAGKPRLTRVSNSHSLAPRTDAVFFWSKPMGHVSAGAGLLRSLCQVAISRQISYNVL